MAGHEVYRTRKHVLGAEQTVLVVYNESLYLGQIQGMAIKLKKATQALREITRELERRRRGEITRGKAPTLKSIRKQVDNILSG